jgi:hypothetical protein
MNAKSEPIVEIVNPSVLGKVYNVNASHCTAIDVRKVCAVDPGFARMRTGQIELDGYQI